MSDRTKGPATVPVPKPGPGQSGSSAADEGTAPRPKPRSGKSKKDDAPPPPLPPVDQKARPVGAPMSPPASPPTVTTPATAASPATDTTAAPRGPRRARLRLTRIDPWTVMKTAFLLSIAFAVVTVVSVAMVWQVLGAAGVWDSINSTIQEAIGGEDVADFQVEDYVGTSRVLGFTMLVAAIDVILITASATLTAFLYNMAAALLGGVEVTLAEDA
jgi:hypothetical protein